MKASLKKALFSLSLVFTSAAILVGCGESRADEYRKPSVAEPLITASLEKCELGPNHATAEEYSARLRNVLEDVDTQDLEVLRDNGLTICLDQRLANLDLGNFDKVIQGTYYPDTKVVSIWDNGKAPGKGGTFEHKTDDYGASVLEKMANKFRDQETDDDQLMYAGRYNCGKNCIRTEWHGAKDFDGDSTSRNPNIHTPPLRGAESTKLIATR